MGFHNKIYIGHVETVNMDTYGKKLPIESKVVALRKNGKTNYRPLRKYGEYYKLSSVEPINGFVTDNRINKELKKTGKPEVKVLKKVC